MPQGSDDIVANYPGFAGIIPIFLAFPGFPVFFSLSPVFLTAAHNSLQVSLLDISGLCSGILSVQHIYKGGYYKTFFI